MPTNPPPPPADLVFVLQDTIHNEVGKSRLAKSVKISTSTEDNSVDMADNRDTSKLT